MPDLPASGQKFIDEINSELKNHKHFVNESGRVAVVTTLRMLFSDEIVFGNVKKPYIASFVSNVDKNLDLFLSKNLKGFGLTPSSKNLLLTIIDGKLIAFLSRALAGTEATKWYERVGRPQQTPQVR